MRSTANSHRIADMDNRWWMNIRVPQLGRLVITPVSHFFLKISTFILYIFWNQSPLLFAASHFMASQRISGAAKCLQNFSHFFTCHLFKEGWSACFILYIFLYFYISFLSGSHFLGVSRAVFWEELSRVIEDQSYCAYNAEISTAVRLQQSSLCFQ